MTFDLSANVPVVPAQFQRADISYWCRDGDLNAIVDLDGVQAVSFQRIDNGTDWTRLACARFDTNWTAENGIQHVWAYVRLTAEQAVTAAQHYGDKSEAHDDVLRQELGIRESVPEPF